MATSKGLHRLTAVLFVLIFVTCLVPAMACAAQDSYAITEFNVGNLSVISEGMRYEVYHFGQNVRPAWVMLDDNGDFIVTERDTFALSRITAEGVRTVIYNFPYWSHPHQAAIDEDGNFIVTNSSTSALYKVTVDGVGSIIHQFPLRARPVGVAIDGDGNYIVTEAGRREVLPGYPEPATLVKITPEGIRSVIFNFEPRTLPHYVAIDEFGNYIIAESYAKKLSRITPDGVRTEVFDFGNYNAEPVGVAIDSNGDYLVTVPGANKLFRITSDGDGYEIFNFVTGTSPVGVALIPSPVLTAAIDIKPGGDPNSINCKNRNGVIPVAVLTTSTANGDDDDLDATQIDPRSVYFGPNNAPVAHGVGHLDDVDSDGDFDLVLHFRASEAGIQCGDTEASLGGVTYDGIEFVGSDAVRTVGK